MMSEVEQLRLAAIDCVILSFRSSLKSFKSPITVADPLILCLYAPPGLSGGGDDGEGGTLGFEGEAGVGGVRGGVSFIVVRVGSGSGDEDRGYGHQDYERHSHGYHAGHGPLWWRHGLRPADRVTYVI